jgi:hypothetical protein
LIIAAPTSRQARATSWNGVSTDTGTPSATSRSTSGSPSASCSSRGRGTPVGHPGVEADVDDARARIEQPVRVGELGVERRQVLLVGEGAGVGVDDAHQHRRPRAQLEVVGARLQLDRCRHRSRLVTTRPERGSVPAAHLAALVRATACGRLATKTRPAWRTVAPRQRSSTKPTPPCWEMRRASGEVMPCWSHTVPAPTATASSAISGACSSRRKTSTMSMGPSTSARLAARPGRRAPRRASD